MTSTPRPEAFPATDEEWELVARLGAGELSDVEAAQVRARLAENPAAAKLVASLERPAHAQRYEAARVDVEAALRGVHAKIGHARSANWHRIPPNWTLPLGGVAIAAGLLFMAIGRRPSAPTPAAVYTSAVGARDSITLPDGSHVVLGPGSRLEVPALYAAQQGANVRAVRLRGEAWFDVKHDASRPFSVTTEAAVITDIGTTFTVHEYAAAGAEVAVQTGAVSLHAAGAPQGAVTLKAGEAGAVSGDRRAQKVDRGGIHDENAWMTGRVIFRDAPMAKVRADVRRWYGLELVTTDSTIATRHLTASFQQETRKQVLDVIALALGATYEVHADSVILRAGVARGSSR